MSVFAVAIGGKADMACCTAYVCFWPKADMSATRQVRFAAPVEPVAGDDQRAFSSQLQSLNLGGACADTFGGKVEPVTSKRQAMVT